MADHAGDASTAGARALFGGVHGVMNLRRDAKLTALPLHVLHRQVEMLVRPAADGRRPEGPNR